MGAVKLGLEGKLPGGHHQRRHDRNLLVNTDSESKSLYWAGTFVAPETPDEPYTWESVNDKEKTDSALLASGDDTKTFTYEKGEISYEASALGTTKTVRLEKAK